MRISDWSSDVCSSDLAILWLTGLGCVEADCFGTEIPATVPARTLRTLIISALRSAGVLLTRIGANFLGSTNHRAHLDRKSVVSGQRVAVLVDLGGRRSIKKKEQTL